MVAEIDIQTCLWPFRGNAVWRKTLSQGTSEPINQANSVLMAYLNLRLVHSCLNLLYRLYYKNIGTREEQLLTHDPENIKRHLLPPTHTSGLDPFFQHLRQSGYKGTKVVQTDVYMVAKSGDWACCAKRDVKGQRGRVTGSEQVVKNQWFRAQLKAS